MKILTFTSSTLLLSSFLFAGGNVQALSPVVETLSPPIVENSWDYTASMYMWGAGIKGQTVLNTEIDVPFSDILDNLDMAFMGTFSAQKGNWGFVLDAINMNLGNQIDANLINRFDFKANIISPTVTYQVHQSDALTLHALMGVQYLYMKNKINGNENRATSGEAWDAIIGLKGDYAFNENWFLPFQVDVGTGDTNTWQVFAGLGYAYENFDVIAGWRSLNWEFDKNEAGGEVFKDLAITGPMIGVTYRF